MRKFYYGIMVAIITFTVILVCYGWYLNYSSEKNIAAGLEGRKIVLHGIRVKKVPLQTIFTLKDVHLTAESTADVVTRNTGLLVEVYVEPGQTVKKGQAIGRVKGEELEIKLAEMNANISRAKTTRDRYKRSYERYSKLLQEGAVSLEKFDDVRSSYLGAEDEIKALLAQKDMYEFQKKELILRSPVDGEVVMLYKKPGSYVASGVPVALIGNMDNLVARLDIEDKYVTHLGSSNDLKLQWLLKFTQMDTEKIFNGKYAGGRQGYEDGFPSKIARIEPPLSIASRYRTISWSIGNGPRLIEPRHYRNVEFVADGMHEGIDIPLTAILKDKLDKVMIWDEKEKYMYERVITLGAFTGGNNVEVIQGLNEGDIVILSDVRRFRDHANLEIHIKGEETHGEK